jgi:hypothetical protein
MRKMHKVNMTQLIASSSLVLGLTLSTVALAQTTSSSQDIPVFPPQPVINQINLQLSTEQWVTTQNADVIVGVDATLDQSQLAQAHADILQKLNKLSSAAQWHITQFDREQDKSGLEQLTVTAQARLPESALADMRNQAKAITVPGETFTVESIAFNPSTAELEAVRSQMRSDIYKKAQDELNQINKMYPDQKYSVHEIDFTEQSVQPQPMVRMAMMAGNAEAAPASAPPLTVANKLILTANVTLAYAEKP